MSYQHPWCARLLASLPDEQIRGAVLADEPRWDYVETELVKLGSLAHSQVDLNAVAEACLGLLENRTKDMRVLAQLLRCLQHPAKATPMGAAFSLLEAWIKAYWLLAWPGNVTQKQRLMVQIIKRFEGGLPRVSESASAAELAQLLAQAEQLEAVWLAQCPDKGALLDPLMMGLKRAQRQQVAQAQADAAVQPASGPVAATATASGMAGTMVLSGSSKGSGVEIDSSNDRAWRQTLLKVAELLIERQPEAAVGYRLRRHAIWAGITTPPMTAQGNKTQLAPMSVDMVDEYRVAMGAPDLAIWQRIEQSLTLAPYWFEGHYLSAEVAQKLGFGTVAQAIMAELDAFLLRLPALRELTFSDGTPFISPECSRWLQPAKLGDAGGGGEFSLAEEVALRHGEQGVAAALALLDERMAQLKEPRARFHAQLVQAELLEQEGMEALARQHYQHLWQEASRLGLSHWEPGLVSRLEPYATPLSK
jgi:type VI secretion system protein VasJ